MRRRRHRPHAESRESGAVLVAVLGAAAVLGVITAAAVTGVVALVRASEAVVAREQALHAAESVAAAVLDRLDRDAVGWVAVGGPDPRALSHDWRDLDAALAGAPMAPTGVGPQSRVTVRRDGPGVVVDVEARVRGHVRAVRVRARPRSAADLAWAAEHAVLDPAVTGGSRIACGVPRWVRADGPEEPVGLPSSAPCRRTRFDAGLAVSGPMHLDDLPRIALGWAPDGPFTTASAAAPDAPMPEVVTADDAARVDGAFGLRYGPPLLLPVDPAAALGDEWRCTLRGPTLIRLDGPALRIRSPRSHPQHDHPGAPVVDCPGLDPADLTGTVVLVPPDPAIVLVRRDPAARCAVHPLGIAVDEDAVVAQRCGDGTAYVWGGQIGARTVIAEDDVQIVWDVGPDLDVADPARSDAGRLGLVAGGSIVMRRPVGPPLRVIAPFGSDVAFGGPGIPPFGTFPSDAPTATPTRWETPRITAVLVALGGSVRVQNPSAGAAADVPIRVLGGVVQRFIGPTVWEHRDTTGALQGRSGRPLHVLHDPGLERSPPPGLPRLSGGRMRILTWEEVLVSPSAAAP